MTREEKILKIADCIYIAEQEFKGSTLASRLRYTAERLLTLIDGEEEA